MRWQLYFNDNVQNFSDLVFDIQNRFTTAFRVFLYYSNGVFFSSVFVCIHLKTFQDTLGLL